MRIDPAIAALQRDPSLQRRSQQVLVERCRAWQRSPAVAPLLAEVRAFGEGAAIDDCPLLQACFTGQGEAERLAGSLATVMAALLREEPFGQPPFRHSFDGQLSSLLLLREGRADLLLQSREPGKWEHEAATFSDAVRFEAVLAGCGEGVILRRAIPPGTAPLDIEPIRLGPGARLSLALSEQALQVTRVDRRLVTLRLQRASADAGPVRRHAIADGRLLHQSAARLATSRQEMMVSLLGRMRRHEAAPELAAIALEAGDRSLRWQALRECLALDTLTGFRALAAVARNPADPIGEAAGALRAQLVELHPELLHLEDGPCPA